VARKKRRTHSWRWTLLVFVGTPFAVWFLAFIGWFFWPDIEGLFRTEKKAGRPTVRSPQIGDNGKDHGGQAARPARENIPEEDRKKLDNLLKRR